MPNLTVILCPTTHFGSPTGNYDGVSSSFFTDQAKGAGYFGFTDALHTVSYTTSDNFVGIITMQGTLATNPTSTDWCDIPNTVLGDGFTVINTTQLYNFTGNFVWVRAKISAFSAGSINNIMYNRS